MKIAYFLHCHYLGQLRVFMQIEALSKISLAESEMKYNFVILKSQRNLFLSNSIFLSTLFTPTVTVIVQQTFGL